MKLTELLALPLVVPSGPNALRRLLEAHTQPRGLALDIVAEVDSVLTVLLLVARGVAHTVLPASARRLWTYPQTLHEGLRSCRPRCATVSCWRSPGHGPPADRNGRRPNCCARSRCTSTVRRHRTSGWAP